MRPVVLAVALVANALLLAVAASHYEMSRADLRVAAVLMLIAWVPLSVSAGSIAYYVVAPIVVVVTILGWLVWMPFVWPVALGALVGLFLPGATEQWMLRLLPAGLVVVVVGLFVYGAWAVPGTQPTILVCLGDDPTGERAELVFDLWDRTISGDGATASGARRSIAVTPEPWASDDEIARFIRGVERPPIDGVVASGRACP